MPYPTELTPDPLIISTVELRFRSKVEPDSLLSRVLPQFLDVFPNVKPANKPAIILSPADAVYLPQQTLINDQYVFAFGPNMLSFENNGKYPLWKNYFPFIKEQLTRFLSLGIIEEVQRIGVRYASIFENEFDVFKVLKTVPMFSIPGFDEQLAMIRSELKRNQFAVTVQALPKAIVEKHGRQRSGIVIDIDASYNSPLMPNEQLFSIIDELHALEKGVFFDYLLKPEFVKQLNPVY